MSESADRIATNGAVTVLVARRVHPGMEVEFEDWAEELTRAASEFDGFLGAGLLRPGHVGDDWHVVYRFSSPDSLARWESSPVRQRLLAEGERVMSTANVHRVSGLETWFELPGRTAPAPPRWKMFIVSAAVIFVLQLCLSIVLPESTGLWLVPRIAVIVVGTAALMTWWVQPWLARMLEGWLYGPRRSASTR